MQVGSLLVLRGWAYITNTISVTSGWFQRHHQIYQVKIVLSEAKNVIRLYDDHYDNFSWMIIEMPKDFV